MKNLLSVALLSLTMVLFSCSDDNKQARLSIRLTDAPGDYQEVLIDVQDVQINVSADENSGWQSLQTTQKGVYNLLDFTNGMDTLLVDEFLPAGKISQMRLVLGDKNQVMIDDVYYDLDTPSAQQSGLKFNIHADLNDGITYKLWIDFDAGRSIVAKGNGSYSLKPVIRTFTEATSGAIKGSVTPVEATPYIMAVSADEEDTVGTYADTETGFFMLRGVEPGSYTITVQPAEGYLETTLEDVKVEFGQVTELETITIEEVVAE
ncbi:DUF4382 domain-containing protein [Carboxylicivirga sediminis]|uniref:DUF4382 domain-containing protein n=1 Tax=Carboxylicivirga sediminis TaxID=2006564 RepID=A0A941IXG2_9BACT|nr:DUF4382 domain-containing protein [Carboxylicivirga sediminis]MBR8535364.1 DUF4382 domain-containing protein [Carboxylicivirga sediminis]